MSSAYCTPCNSGQAGAGRGKHRLSAGAGAGRRKLCWARKQMLPEAEMLPAAPRWSISEFHCEQADPFASGVSTMLWVSTGRPRGPLHPQTAPTAAGCSSKQPTCQLHPQNVLRSSCYPQQLTTSKAPAHTKPSSTRASTQFHPQTSPRLHPQTCSFLHIRRTTVSRRKVLSRHACSTYIQQHPSYTHKQHPSCTHKPAAPPHPAAPLCPGGRSCPGTPAPRLAASPTRRCSRAAPRLQLGLQPGRRQNENQRSRVSHFGVVCGRVGAWRDRRSGRGGDPNPQLT